MMQEQYAVKVLEKAVKILDVYSQRENAFTLDEITKKTKLSKSTIFRILRTLEKHGFLRYDPEEGLYRLGLRFMELGGIVSSSTTVRKSAAIHLDQLARTLKTTVLVGVILEGQFAYIDKREWDSILKIPSYLGAKIPPTHSFLGMTLLAFMDNGERKRFFGPHSLRKHTKKTITKMKEIEIRLNQARKNSYYMERGEFFEGVMSIGVPIQGAAGNTVAALGACLPEFRPGDDHIEQALQELIRTSKAISKELEFSSSSRK
jgi:IclR family transcriptional regulator, KDG regulon repressor